MEEARGIGDCYESRAWREQCGDMWSVRQLRQCCLSFQASQLFPEASQLKCDAAPADSSDWEARAIDRRLFRGQCLTCAAQTHHHEACGRISMSCQDPVSAKGAIWAMGKQGSGGSHA